MTGDKGGGGKIFLSIPSRASKLRLWNLGDVCHVHSSSLQWSCIMTSHDVGIASWFQKKKLRNWISQFLQNLNNIAKVTTEKG